ncbi:four helix bundle protein [Candidatus Kaiserbacteria bacterium]|nr:four helix bundle protein [Candidatus Kaiserbacteria bacterium]
MQSYKDLTVWQRSIELVENVYKLTEKFPKTEMFGLTSQIRPAAVSIPANIAEGYARKHRAEYIQFIRIAYGSGAELETHIIISERLKFTDSKDLEKTKQLLDEVMRMLNKFISSLAPRP